MFKTEEYRGHTVCYNHKRGGWARYARLSGYGLTRVGDYFFDTLPEIKQHIDRIEEHA